MSDEKRFKRVIIDWSEDKQVLREQVRIAANAVKSGIQPGELWGVRTECNETYSVKANKRSIRVRING